MNGNGGNNKNKYYLFSMTLIFMFFYAVLILTNSEKIYEIAENMYILKSILQGISVLAVFVSFKFSLDGIKQTLIIDKKRIGIYLLFGDNCYSLSLKLTKELLGTVVIAAMGGGILGIIYGHFIIGILKVIFGFDNITLKIISVQIVIIYFLFILLVIVINYITANYLLSKKDIKSLIVFEEGLALKEISLGKINVKGNVLVLIVLGVINIILLLFYIKNIEKQIAFYSLLLGIIFFGIEIYKSLRLILYIKVKNSKFTDWSIEKQQFKNLYDNEVKRYWKKYYKNQCTSGTIIILATLCLFVSLTVGYSYKENIAKEAPFDFAVSIDANMVKFDEIVQQVSPYGIKNSLNYKIYQCAEFEKYNLPIQCMKLSDYNYLRSMLGINQVSIANNEYLVQVEDEIIKDKILREVDNSQKEVYGNRYTMGEEIQLFPFLQANINGNFELIVLNDSEFDKLDLEPFRSVYIATFDNTPNQSLKNEIYRLINMSENIIDKAYIGEHITVKVILKEWSRLNGLVGLSAITIMGIFFSSILMLLGTSNISIFCIRNLEKLLLENNIYYRIGWNTTKINRYNAYRIKEMQKTTLLMNLLIVVTITCLLYFKWKNYFDNDLMMFVFSLISIVIYLLIMLGYDFNLRRILYCDNK